MHMCMLWYLNNCIHKAVDSDKSNIMRCFVTSFMKFTSLHSVANIKQKNIDAIKVSRTHILVYHLYKW